MHLPTQILISQHIVEYFYSFHFDMLDLEPGWNKVEIPLTGTNVPDQTLPYTFGFNNTGWNGVPGDGNFDLDAIKGFALEFFVDSPPNSSGDSVNGVIILDELKVENTVIEGPEEVNVTFQVDMSNEDINPACAPSIGGGWNGWQWTYTLEEGQDDIWSTTITVNAGVEYEYKFGNCGWELEDLEPGSDCTNTVGIYTNRVLEAVNEDTVLDPICFGTCDPECSSPELVNVTFQVDTNNDDTNFDPMCDMFLISSFQTPFPWDIDLFPINLVDDDDDGVWDTTVSILSGTYVEYKFANCEGSDAFIESEIENCSANGSRYMTVPYEDIVLDATYFNSCNSDGNVTVTFQVDMSNQETGGGDGVCGVHIGGTFNYFDFWANELTDEDSNNIWSADVILESGSQIEYKFANCGSFGIESVPEDCGFGEDLNRTFMVPNQDAIINPVCFGGCSQECGDLNYSNVTISVDMSSIETASTGVFASGPGAMQGPSGIPLYDNGNDIWSATISLPYGEYTYKFRNGYYSEWDSDGWEEEALLEECGYGAYNDRFLFLDEPTVITDTVCFESCDICSENIIGDINQDSSLDVLDIVLIVNHVIGMDYLDTMELALADFNNDSFVDVLDIVGMVNNIISE